MQLWVQNKLAPRVFASVVKRQCVNTCEFRISAGILNLGKLLCSTFSGFVLLGCPFQYLYKLLKEQLTILTCLKLEIFSVAFAWQRCAFEICVKSEAFLAIDRSEKGWFFCIEFIKAYLLWSRNVVFSQGLWPSQKREIKSFYPKYCKCLLFTCNFEAWLS